MKNKLFEKFVNEVLGKPPFQNKQKKRFKTSQEKKKCNECGRYFKPKIPQDRKEWNERRKVLYAWQIRAKAVGVPLLPAHRPIRGERQEWEYKIIEEEMETIL